MTPIDRARQLFDTAVETQTVPSLRVVRNLGGGTNYVISQIDDSTLAGQSSGVTSYRVTIDDLVCAIESGMNRDSTVDQIEEVSPRLSNRANLVWAILNLEESEPAI